MRMEQTLEVLGGSRGLCLCPMHVVRPCLIALLRVEGVARAGALSGGPAAPCSCLGPPRQSSKSECGQGLAGKQQRAVVWGLSHRQGHVLVLSIRGQGGHVAQRPPGASLASERVLWVIMLGQQAGTRDRT